TFSYSDTQRYRVGTNYLQLPINAPKKHVATNQRDGQMAYPQDILAAANPHVNYEPSSLNGLQEASRTGKDHTPRYQAALVREKIERQNNFKQAGETYRNFEDWERDDLISNLSGAIVQANQEIQDKMIDLFSQCDEDYGRRVAEGIKMKKEMMMSMKDEGVGSEDENEAVKKAEEESNESKPY